MPPSALLEAEPAASSISTEGLSDRDYARISSLVSRHAGIKLPPAKRAMVEGRLRKRARVLGHRSVPDYCRHLFEGDGLENEFTHLIDAVTTNKTDFFREPDHFDWLRDRIAPELIAARGERQPLLKVWSAAASNGAEAYTIAMVMADLAESRGDFRFAVLGTDICTEVLDHARAAVYPAAMVEPVPEDMKRRHLLISRQRVRQQVRIAPELRRLVQFAQLNLMDGSYPFDRDVDVILLRNVLIYFDRPTQQAVVERMISHLRPGGWLLLGHSESMIAAGMRLQQRAPSIFQRL